MWGRPLPWSTARIWALEAGGPDEPGVTLVRNHPGRSLPLVRSRRQLGDDPCALGSSQAHAMDGRWRRSAGHAFDLRRPAQFEARVRRGLDGRPLVHRGCRRELVATWRGHARRVRARRVDPRPASRRTCTASSNVRLRRTACGCSTTTASSSPPTRAGPSQRSPASSRRRSGFRSSCIPQDPDTAWFVPEIKDEKRIPRDGKLVVTRTRDGGASFAVLKNHWGWGGFTTRDLQRCRLMARIVALIYNWWTLVRAAGRSEPAHRGDHQPAAAAVRRRPADPACQSDHDHHHQHARQGRPRSPNAGRGRDLLQVAAANSGAVERPPTMVPNPQPGPGQVPQRPSARTAARSHCPPDPTRKTRITFSADAHVHRAMPVLGLLINLIP